MAEKKGIINSVWTFNCRTVWLLISEKILLGKFDGDSLTSIKCLWYVI